MNDPSRVCVTGPLSVYAEGLRAACEAHGYTPGTVALKLQLAAQLSRWLEYHDLGVEGLGAEQLEAFFRARRKTVKFLYLSPLSLKVLMEHLDELGVLPAPQRTEPSALDTLLELYRRYLLEERRLAEGTVDRYVHVASCFLRSCSTSMDLDLDEVSAVGARRFLVDQCETHTAGWAKAVAVGLRSLLRFLHLEGLIDAPLDQTVPTPGKGVEARLPKALSPAELSALFAACDRARRTAGATTRSSCCSPSLGYAPAKSPGCSSTTSTGGQESSRCAGRDRASTSFRCQSRWGVHWPTT